VWTRPLRHLPALALAVTVNLLLLSSLAAVPTRGTLWLAAASSRSSMRLASCCPQGEATASPVGRGRAATGA
jgi:hypothetical protein